MSKRWIEKYISESDASEISKAVVQAEAGTLGDIVPMIVRRSSAVRHVPVVLSLCFFILFLGLELLGVSGWYLSDLLPIMTLHWGVQVAFLLALCALAWGLSHLHPVQRLLTSNSDEIDQVEKRAQLEFFQQRINRTSRKSAILIFVSVMERRAVVLADEGIAKKFDPKVWDEILRPLSQALREGSWSQGFQDAIRRSGDLLKAHFPAENGLSAGEISNQLIIKD